jgi:hypothetical protein
MQQPLHTCMTKAVIADGDQLRMGPRWLTSRRARLKLYDDHLQCGDWTIAYVDIREAVLAKIRTPLLRIPGYVLSVRTDENTYHFGLNPGSYWKGELPFRATHTTSKLRLSLFIFLIRAALIGYLAYLAWRWLAS